jgi:hypothetical protein
MFNPISISRDLRNVADLASDALGVRVHVCANISNHYPAGVAYRSLSIHYGKGGAIESVESMARENEAEEWATVQERAIDMIIEHCRDAGIALDDASAKNGWPEWQTGDHNNAK